MVSLPRFASDLTAIRAELAALDDDGRANWMHGMSKADMAKLWELGGPLSLSAVVGGEGEIVRLEGQNDLLPFFDRFEKHVVARTGVVQGINVQKFSWVVGPGHFLVRQEGEEVWFDYTQIASSVPEGWPALAPNDKGLSTLVYGNMIDRVREVCPKMIVGKVFRHGKPENHYFMAYRR
jgi:hypothetical protein